MQVAVLGAGICSVLLRYGANVALDIDEAGCHRVAGEISDELIGVIKIA